MNGPPARLPHASLNEPSRRNKARKIERLLSTTCEIPGADVLEIGTGAGFIAAHFASLIGPEGTVHAVDVVDQRRVHEGFDFRVVEDTSLPFGDDTFDICVSNHVLEHEGDRAAQAEHLREINRVLRSDGCLYLAVPNRWTLIEPHFRLPLLSWLPRSLGDRYVRLAGRGSHYDCDPPSHAEIESLLSCAGFSATDVSVDSIQIVANLKLSDGFHKRLLVRTGTRWFKLLRAVFPSYLFLAKRG